MGPNCFFSSSRKYQSFCCVRVRQEKGEGGWRLPAGQHQQRERFFLGKDEKHDQSEDAEQGAGDKPRCRVAAAPFCLVAAAPGKEQAKQDAEKDLHNFTSSLYSSGSFGKVQLESAHELSFSRFLGLFEPIFDQERGVISAVYITPRSWIENWPKILQKAMELNS